MYLNWDLTLTMREIKSYSVDENSKKILKEIIKYLTYGSIIQNPYKLSLLEINLDEIITGIITDRNTFWNTIWSDEKFPKD